MLYKDDIDALVIRAICYYDLVEYEKTLSDCIRIEKLSPQSISSSFEIHT
jgi:hypothetical protein